MGVPYQEAQTITANRWLQAATVTPWIHRALEEMNGLQSQGFTGTGKDPRILAVFEHSCYAGSGPNLLFCLGLPAIGKGPLNLLLGLSPGTTFDQLGFRKGDSISVENGFVRLGPQRILLKGAEVWTPPPARSWTAPIDALRSRLDSLASVAVFHPEPLGLGLLAAFVHQPPGQKSIDTLPPLANLLFPFARQLLGGILSENLDLMEAGARGLIGAGPGLTPSGDDFLGAFFAAIRAMGPSVYRPEFLGQACSRICRLAAGRTPMISESLLRCALEGAVSDSLHDLISLVLSGDRSQSQDSFDSVMRKVAKRGHSSGWDALAGMAWGLKAGEVSLRGLDPFV